MGNREFGNLVGALRRQRTFYDELGRELQWTQKKLAKETMILTAKQIGDVEQGKVTNLRPDIYLEPLANAFNLNEAEKVEFYAVAGYVYPVKRHAKDKDIVRILLQQFSCPATARSPLWDFVAFNSYNYVLWGYTEDRMNALRDGELGPNLLRVLFDPIFDLKILFGGEEKWRREMARNIQAFRVTSFRYIAEPRYRQIRNGMKKYPEFERLWELSEYPDSEFEGIPVRPTITVYHPEFGKIPVMSFRVPQLYLGQDIYISAYIPPDPSDKNYQELCNSVRKNTVHFFADLSEKEVLSI